MSHLEYFEVPAQADNQEQTITKKPSNVVKRTCFVHKKKQIIGKPRSAFTKHAPTPYANTTQEPVLDYCCDEPKIAPNNFHHAKATHCLKVCDNKCKKKKPKRKTKNKPSTNKSKCKLNPTLYSHGINANLCLNDKFAKFSQLLEEALKETNDKIHKQRTKGPKNHCHSPHLQLKAKRMSNRNKFHTYKNKSQNKKKRHKKDKKIKRILSLFQTTKT
jgi:hypothetical protein